VVGASARRPRVRDYNPAMRDTAARQTPGSGPLFGRLATTVAAIALATAVIVAAPEAQALFVVNQPWVKPGTHASEAYMILTSTEGATLIGVHSAIAAQAALRGPGTPGRARASLPLPAGASVALRPRANRIALTGLVHALRLGERVPLTLLVETAPGVNEEIAVDAEVRSESPLDAERDAHHH
jgi:copper(I)-binding protein